MAYLTVWLLLCLFTWNAFGSEEDSIKNPTILQDFIDLSAKTQNISKEVEQLVSQVENLPDIGYNKHLEDKYVTLPEPKSSLRHCDSLRNTYEMITSHVKEMLQQCYERAKKMAESLKDRVTTIQNTLKEEITKWAMNNSMRNRRAVDASETDKDAIDHLTISRIESIKKALERFQVFKKLREFETNLSVRFCGAVANTYEEESRNLYQQLEECILPQYETKGATTKTFDETS